MLHLYVSLTRDVVLRLDVSICTILCCTAACASVLHLEVSVGVYSGRAAPVHDCLQGICAAPALYSIYLEMEVVCKSFVETPKQTEKVSV